MAYTKTNWLDRQVQYPNRYTKSGDTATEVTLTPDPGTVTAEGTPISAANMNKIEQGIADVDAAVEAFDASVDNLQSALTAHEANSANPHYVTKTQVGLGNVLDYGVASQAQAQAGSVNTAYMTPLRTKEYVDQRLQNNVRLRISGGALQYYNGSGWESVAAVKSVQRGVVEVSGYPTDITIAAINPEKAMVNLTSLFGVRGSSNGNQMLSAMITSPTNLRFESSGTVSIMNNFSWEVIEYY